MEKPKQKRRTRKREEIISTAERLFSRFGSKRVTVEELCREAGVSKMTFYKYFANKVELVQCIKDNWVEEGFEKFDRINALDIPFSEKIELMSQWEMEFASRINAEFITELFSIDDVKDRSKRRYLSNIAAAQKKGEVRSDIDPEFLWMVGEKIKELIMEGRWKSVFSDFSQFQKQFRTLIYFGLLTRPEEEKCGGEMT